MKSDGCQPYLDDPEANGAHLAECEECRLLFSPAAVAVEPKPLSVDALPLAPWEGATHRPWPLVIVGALLVAAAAAAIFVAGGTSPLSGVSSTLSSTVPSLDLLKMIPQLVGTAAQHAPAGWQIAVGVSFVVVNAVLVLLLRRAPKGIDA